MNTDDSSLSESIVLMLDCYISIWVYRYPEWINFVKLSNHEIIHGPVDWWLFGKWNLVSRVAQFLHRWERWCQWMIVVVQDGSEEIVYATDHIIPINMSSLMDRTPPFFYAQERSTTIQYRWSHAWMLVSNRIRRLIIGHPWDLKTQKCFDECCSGTPGFGNNNAVWLKCLE